MEIADFQEYFDRDFTFSEALPDIREADIQKALDEALTIFNEDLYPTAEVSDKCLLYLTAHFLVNNIDSSDMGGQVKILQNSRGADGLNESLAVPEWMNAGEFAFFSTTAYGQKFLILSKPYLDGAVFVSQGATQY